MHDTTGRHVVIFNLNTQAATNFDVPAGDGRFNMLEIHPDEESFVTLSWNSRAENGGYIEELVARTYRFDGPEAIRTVTTSMTDGALPPSLGNSAHYQTCFKDSTRYVGIFGLAFTHEEQYVALRHMLVEYNFVSDELTMRPLDAYACRAAVGVFPECADILYLPGGRPETFRLLVASTLDPITKIWNLDEEDPIKAFIETERDMWPRAIIHPRPYQGGNDRICQTVGHGDMVVSVYNGSIRLWNFSSATPMTVSDLRYSTKQAAKRRDRLMERLRQAEKRAGYPKHVLEFRVSNILQFTPLSDHLLTL